MKTKIYTVTHETDAEVISTYSVRAINLREAKLYAQINKPAKRCRTEVRLDRNF